jgi:hypothetical protein
MAIGCSKPPKSYSRWTLHLFVDEILRLKIADSISYEEVHWTLKKAKSNPT